MIHLVSHGHSTIEEHGNAHVWIAFLVSGLEPETIPYAFKIAAFSIIGYRLFLLVQPGVHLHFKSRQANNVENEVLVHGDTVAV